MSVHNHIARRKKKVACYFKPRKSEKKKKKKKKISNNMTQTILFLAKMMKIIIKNQKYVLQPVFQRIYFLFKLNS